MDASENKGFVVLEWGMAQWLRIFLCNTVTSCSHETMALADHNGSTRALANGANSQT